MQNLSHVQTTGTSHVRRILLFAFHQLMSTIGIAVISGVLCFFIVRSLHMVSPSLTAMRASWLLTEVPGFPVQVLVGVVLGFLLERATRSRSALWVWIIPSLFLCFGAVIVVHPASSTLAHLFGSGCKPAAHCFDQLLFTLPFLASLGYTAGAALGRFKSRCQSSGPFPPTTS
jgi:hypothetical protein